MFDLSVLIIALLGTPALIRFMQRASDPSLDRQILTVSGVTLLIHVSAVLSPITNKNLPWILFWSVVLITIFVYSLNRVLSSSTVEPAHISVKTYYFYWNWFKRYTDIIRIFFKLLRRQKCDSRTSLCQTVNMINFWFRIYVFTAAFGLYNLTLTTPVRVRNVLKLIL